MRRLMNQVQKYERHEISFYRGLEYNYGANWSTVLPRDLLGATVHTIGMGMWLG